MAKEEIRTSRTPNPQEFYSRCALARGQPWTDKGEHLFHSRWSRAGPRRHGWASHASTIRAAAESLFGQEGQAAVRSGLSTLPLLVLLDHSVSKSYGDPAHGWR